MPRAFGFPTGKKVSHSSRPSPDGKETIYDIIFSGTASRMRNSFRL